MWPTLWCNQHVFHVLCITSLDWNTLCYIPRSKRIPWCYTHSFIVSTFFYYLWCYPTCCSASVATAYMYLNAWLSVRYFSFFNIIVSDRSATVIQWILVFTNRCALSKRLRNLVELMKYWQSFTVSISCNTLSETLMLHGFLKYQYGSTYLH